MSPYEVFLFYSPPFLSAFLNPATTIVLFLETGVPPLAYSWYCQSFENCRLQGSPTEAVVTPEAGPFPWGWAWMARDLEAGIHDDLMHLDTCWAPLVSCVLSNRAAVL